VNTVISGQGLEVTPALESRVSKGLSGISRRSERDTDRIEVVLGREGDRCFVKLHAVIGSSAHNIQTESHDMYTAIDDASHKLNRVVSDAHSSLVEGKRRNPKP